MQSIALRSIALPIALRADAPEPANDRAGALRILLAEDNDTMRRLLAFVLRADGHDVVEARDGAALLEALAASLLGTTLTFDAIVSEQTLPGGSGLAVLTGLRARGLATPFVLITAAEEAQHETLRLGGVVLDQPFNVSAIRAAVASSARPAPRAHGSDGRADQNFQKPFAE
jgi:DNA-binding response OmpR family regulator